VKLIIIYKFNIKIGEQIILESSAELCQTLDKLLVLFHMQRATDTVPGNSAPSNLYVPESGFKSRSINPSV
jgi:hypothetical protein